ncbi:GNAT family N-acetyltransferase [Kaistella polysaccharea]|uniref:GNAT family N-acetyltransferase n=1 Tax=Kaistella polysaccharea TaxID=2878534 RepID=UPI001CF4B56C|nr:GNAT family N-acetyltransferase [Kaistella polysaccharea]
MVPENTKIQIHKAETADAPEIWKILQHAITRRKIDGSTQWQDGYPNPDTIHNDIAKGYGFTFSAQGKIAGYAAVILDLEPEYEELNTWECKPPYAVIHRVAVGSDFLNKGVATEIFRSVEKLVLDKKIGSIRVDTISDNEGMLRIFEKLNYIYRGEVFVRGAARRAFEKKLS